MAVIVETGAIVTGANSFCDSAYVDAYAAARGRTEWLAASPQSQRDQAVIQGGDYLKNEARYPYRGTRVSYLQTMPFPRTGASEYRGPTLPSNYVSWRLMDANAELAIRAFASPGSLQPDLERGGAVKREKVDSLETEYFDKAPVETTIRAVAGILAPLLMLDGTLPANPTLSQFDADPENIFDPGTFANPPVET